MSQNDKISPIPNIEPSRNPRGGDSAVYDSLRFSYDIDRDSTLEYSEDGGREIDFEFQQFPEYQFKNEDRNNTLDQSGLHRKLEIFEKYRNKNYQEENNKGGDIVDSFDQIFNIKDSKSGESSGKYLFKKKNHNQDYQQTSNQQNFKPTTSQIKDSTNNFILGQGSQKNIQEPLPLNKIELKTDTSLQNLNSQRSKNDLNDNTLINQLKFSNVSQASNSSNNNVFIPRQAPNFSNPFSQERQMQADPNFMIPTGSNKSIQVDDYRSKPEIVTQSNIKGPTINFPPPSNVTSLHNIGEGIQKPVNTFNVENFINNNNKRDMNVNVNIVNPTMVESRTEKETSIKGIINEVEQSKKLACPIFEEENRIAPLFKKIRKMNSIYPNFNHPAICLENEAKFCNVLAAIFEQAFNVLQKMAIKALDRAKQPKYFQPQFAHLHFFVNSFWQVERYREWEMLGSTLKPRTNFPKNDIDESKIKGALANYREVIVYYKEKKMQLGSQQSIKSYFRIRQKFWSLQRNMRSISQDIYKIFQQTEYPQFYYDYLNILRAPLPAKNDQKTIRHHQQVLRVLIMNRQRMEPLSCSEVGQAVKVKLEKELKFLCPF